VQDCIEVVGEGGAVEDEFVGGAGEFVEEEDTFGVELISLFFEKLQGERMQKW
jgi:hypothetical protein